MKEDNYQGVTRKFAKGSTGKNVYQEECVDMITIALIASSSAMGSITVAS